MPIYESLGEVSIRYIIEHSESECVFASASNLIALSRALKPLKGAVKVVIYWGKCNTQAVQVCMISVMDLGVSFVMIASVMSLGSLNPL